MHGADVLWVTSPNLPALPMIDLDTSRGKRTTQLDLNNSTDSECLRSLVKDADVFLQAYRPGGLASRGFSVEEVTGRNDQSPGPPAEPSSMSYPEQRASLSLQVGN